MRLGEVMARPAFAVAGPIVAALKLEHGCRVTTLTRSLALLGFCSKLSMAAVNVTSVKILDNPAPFTNPLQFEIEYECSVPLPHDLEWKLIYVGSAESEKYDQVLDSVLVGPVYPGNYRFVFQADPPDHTKLPDEDIVGVTVLLLTCSYNGKEFVRIGYYVNNDYEEEELRQEPPEKPIIEKLHRSILADHPRVTKFAVNFDEENGAKEEEQNGAVLAEQQLGGDTMMEVDC